MKYESSEKFNETSTCNVFNVEFLSDRFLNGIMKHNGLKGAFTCLLRISGLVGIRRRFIKVIVRVVNLLNGA